MIFRERRRKDLHIDVINMVDVFLNLLIFFMLSTTFIVSPGIKVNLPKSSVDVISKEQRDVRIWIPRDGSIYLDKNPVNDVTLKESLTQVFKENSQTLVIIQADEAVTHGKVVEVMDLVRNTGLTRVAIATQPKETSSRSQEPKPPANGRSSSPVGTGTGGK